MREDIIIPNDRHDRYTGERILDLFQDPSIRFENLFGRARQFVVDIVPRAVACPEDEIEPLSVRAGAVGAVFGIEMGAHPVGREPAKRGADQSAGRVAVTAMRWKQALNAVS